MDENVFRTLIRLSPYGLSRVPRLIATRVSIRRKRRSELSSLHRNALLGEDPMCLDCLAPVEGGADYCAGCEWTRTLTAFVRESNRIEGIGVTTDAHVEAHRQLLSGPLHIPALVELVSALQPNARFRNSPGVPGVRVGNHIAPPSGPDIEGNLRLILAMRDPWEQHIAYETLHPFTDGNGRSGRAIWLHRHFFEEFDPWAIRRGFLHSWYYHTLSSVRRDSDGSREAVET